ncbi:hypothetical protein BASA82_000178, partial [Batrachochytrium salamandrivorans]
DHNEAGSVGENNEATDGLFEGEGGSVGNEATGGLVGEYDDLEAGNVGENNEARKREQ